MKVAIFCHSLVSDWNHGNAHFLRGVAAELVRRGHEVDVHEPADGWSRANLVRDHGAGAVDEFRAAYPMLRERYHDERLDLDRVLDGVDLALVHEWNDPGLVARIGAHRARSAQERLGVAGSVLAGLQHEDRDLPVGARLIPVVIGPHRRGPLPPLAALGAGELTSRVIALDVAVLQLDMTGYEGSAPVRVLRGRCSALARVHDRRCDVPAATPAVVRRAHAPEPRNGRAVLSMSRSELMAQVRVTVDGVNYADDVEPRMLLVYYLRERLGKTGTVVGCDTSNCGACTVHLNGQSVKSCSVLAVQADGGEVTTIEGIARDGKLHPVQQAFHENHALQCGYCTPGMIMQAIDLLGDNPDPDEQEVREGIEGNLCRCTGYHNIVKAVQAAAQAMKPGAPADTPAAASVAGGGN